MRLETRSFRQEPGDKFLVGVALVEDVSCIDRLSRARPETPGEGKGPLAVRLSDPAAQPPCRRSSTAGKPGRRATTFFSSNKTRKTFGMFLTLFQRKSGIIFLCIA